MRKLSVKFQHVLASDRESDAGTGSSWLIVVQMKALYCRCYAAFKKTNVFPVLFLTDPLPCVGSGIYPVTKELHQQVIQAKTKLFFPSGVREQKTLELKSTVRQIGRGILFLQGIEQLYCQNKAWSVVFSGTCMLNNSTYVKSYFFFPFYSR